MYIRHLGLMLAALALGTVLKSFHLPIPFMMAGMIVTIICKVKFRGVQNLWPKMYREYALYVAGFSIGAKFTHDAWNSVVNQLAGVVITNVLLLLLSLSLAYITHKWIHEDLKSCIMGMMPGGLTVALLMSEEDEDCNPNVIMVMQVIRLLGVLFLVPLMVVFLFEARATEPNIMSAGPGNLPWYILFISSPLGYYLAKRFSFPTPRLLGPIITSALIAINSDGLQSPPGWMMMLAQSSIGLLIGTQMDLDRMAKAKSSVPCVIAGTCAMLLFTTVMGTTMAKFYGFDNITAFLAMAPGGIAEMTLAGLSMGADVSIILAYQLVRMFSINFAMPVISKFIDKHPALRGQG